MKKLTLLFLGAVLGIVQTAAAQQSAGPDYLVLQRGDTLRGSIRVSKLVTEQGVRFRSSPNVPYTVYMPGEVRAFGLADGQRFVRRKLVLVQRAQAGARILSESRDSVNVLLHQLTTGAGRLYRFDYSQGRQLTALDLTSRETTFFLMETPAFGISILEQISFRALLGRMFAGCEAAEQLLPHVQFEESDLVRLALSYGSCAPALPATDLRRSVADANTFRAHYSVRGGLVSTQLYYPSLGVFQKANSTAEKGTSAGVFMTLRRKSNMGFGLGAVYANRKSTAQTPHVVPAGYSNAGSTLNLRSSVAVNTLQLPVWAEYSLTGTRLQPFLAAGPSFGFLYSNKTTIGQTLFFLPPGTSGQPIQQTTETQVANVAGRTSMLLGGHISVGIRPQLGRISPVLEIGYEAGKEAGDGYLGTISMQGSFARIGLEL